MLTEGQRRSPRRRGGGGCGGEGSASWKRRGERELGAAAAAIEERDSGKGREAIYLRRRSCLGFANGPSCFKIRAGWTTAQMLRSGSREVIESDGGPGMPRGEWTYSTIFSFI
mgnify:CR=1 FL=1